VKRLRSTEQCIIGAYASRTLGFRPRKFVASAKSTTSRLSLEREICRRMSRQRSYRSLPKTRRSGGFWSFECLTTTRRKIGCQINSNAGHGA
jgi:hypothetical protein